MSPARDPDAPGVGWVRPTGRASARMGGHHPPDIVPVHGHIGPVHRPIRLNLIPEGACSRITDRFGPHGG